MNNTIVLKVKNNVFCDSSLYLTTCKLSSKSRASHEKLTYKEKNKIFAIVRRIDKSAFERHTTSSMSGEAGEQFNMLCSHSHACSTERY